MKSAVYGRTIPTCPVSQRCGGGSTLFAEMWATRYACRSHLAHNQIMKTSIAFCLLVGVFAFGVRARAHTVDPRTFFTSIQGDYEIVSAGGQPPHAETKDASIAVGASEVTWVMPYCTDIGCDPGYYAYSPDALRLDEPTPGQFVMAARDGSAFEWKVAGSQVVFRNLKYPSATGTQVLEHVLKAKP